MGTSAFFLYCSVESFYECIVVRSSDSTVTNTSLSFFEQFLKVSAILRAIVCLNHCEVKACVGLSPLNDRSSQLLTQEIVMLNICPARIDINQSIQIGPALGGIVIKMYCIGLN